MPSLLLLLLSAGMAALWDSLLLAVVPKFAPLGLLPGIPTLLLPLLPLLCQGTPSCCSRSE
jgi:hypothetical protein